MISLTTHLGLIFAEKSPRKVASISEAQSVVQAVQKYGERTAPLSLETELSHLRADQLTSKAWFSRSAKLLEKITLRRPLVVGVFQDQDLAEVNRIAREAGLDLIQLHGRETVEYISKLELPCIKVVHIPAPVMTADALDVEATSLSLLQEKMEAFAGHAVAVILDTSVRGDASGGTGITFDWSLATKLDSSVILAGGLKSENVEDAARVEGVVGLDVSSGVEVAGSPGVKDPLLVEAFLKKARLVKTKT